MTKIALGKMDLGENVGQIEPINNTDKFIELNELNFKIKALRDKIHNQRNHKKASKMQRKLMRMNIRREELRTELG